VAFKIGAKTGDPMAMYMADIFTVTTSLAAMPCLSMPAGFSAPADAPGLSMPVGMQLIGPPLSDVRLLEWAHAFQLVTDHHRKTPPLDC
jgi:aspartyl-tRNA(Asn)/glutamyl-tRNA(Gln) amidotransferase subunit A